NVPDKRSAAGKQRTVFAPPPARPHRAILHSLAPNPLPESQAISQQFGDFAANFHPSALRNSSIMVILAVKHQHSQQVSLISARIQAVWRTIRTKKMA